MNKLGDRYVLLDQLGAGAMGVVWRARDELLHRDVAVKQLLLNEVQPSEFHEAVQRAMREGRIAARLQHPNAIAVYDVVVDEGKPCLVMEYLPSKNLSSILSERGPMPPLEAARIGSLAAGALAAAHDAGIVHRDIKPGNVLIGRDGSVKITDFGISRALGDVAVTKTGMLAGTPAYLAPELARGADPASPSDMFSLGATIYAMTEGEPPFGKSTNDLGLLYKVARGETRPPMRSGPLTPLLIRLLANEPSQRPTAAQAAEELKAIASGAVVPATRVIPPRSMTPPPLGTAVMPSGPGTQGPMTQGPRTVPPQGPRTAPPRTPPPPEPYDDELYEEPYDEPKPKKSRGLAIAASILAVLLISGVAYALVENDDDRSSASGLTNSSTPVTNPSTGYSSPAQTPEKPAANTPAAPPQQPAQTKPSAPPSSSSPSATKFNQAQVAAFVQQHYAKLPQDPAAARRDWAPGKAPRAESDDEYWTDYSKVVLRKDAQLTLSDDIAAVTVTLDLTDAESNKVTTEQHTLKLIANGDKIQIVAEER